MSLHRFTASRPLVLQAATAPTGSFGIAAAILCPVMATADGIAVNYDRAAAAKAQLQAMLAAVARHDPTVPLSLPQSQDHAEAPDRVSASNEARRLAN
jgi:hypothetical protein